MFFFSCRQGLECTSSEPFQVAFRITDQYRIFIERGPTTKQNSFPSGSDCSDSLIRCTELSRIPWPKH